MVPTETLALIPPAISARGILVVVERGGPAVSGADAAPLRLGHIRSARAVGRLEPGAADTASGDRDERNRVFRERGSVLVQGGQVTGVERAG